jgi:magnesium-transporting ATPase (P-type)
MVTGDHPVTALAIGHELGLADRAEQVVIHLEHVTAGQWLVSLALALSLFLVAEAHKILLRRRARAQATG